MASLQENRRRMGGEKASGLSAGDRIAAPETGNTVSGKGKRSERKLSREESSAGKPALRVRALVVDLILLVMLAAVVVGCVFGYRALKQVYDPSWEEKQVEFCIRIRGVNMDAVYDEDGRSIFEDSHIWHTDRVDGDLLGTVVDVESHLEDGGDTVTLYLTVQSEALYRKGEGYYVGDTRLLAGNTGTFRVQGMTSEGVITTLAERQ